MSVMLSIVIVMVTVSPHGLVISQSDVCAICQNPYPALPTPKPTLDPTVVFPPDNCAAGQCASCIINEQFICFCMPCESREPCSKGMYYPSQRHADGVIRLATSEYCRFATPEELIGCQAVVGLWHTVEMRYQQSPYYCVEKELEKRGIALGQCMFPDHYSVEEYQSRILQNNEKRLPFCHRRPTPQNDIYTCDCVFSLGPDYADAPFFCKKDACDGVAAQVKPCRYPCMLYLSDFYIKDNWYTPCIHIITREVCEQ